MSELVEHTPLGMRQGIESLALYKTRHDCSKS